ncbi:unnamed protein product, partial [Cylicostephanus goldi]
YFCPSIYLLGPSTFTGEDTAELYVHGSRAVADALSERLAGFEGVRQATRGEFTKRAFFNGKMDFHEVHGLKNLIYAETQRQRQMSYGQMRGGAEARRIRYLALVLFKLEAFCKFKLEFGQKMAD